MMKLQLVFLSFSLLLVIAPNFGSPMFKNASVFNSRFENAEILSRPQKAREETKLKILKGLGLSAPPAFSHRQKLIYRQKSIRYRRGLNRKTKSELKIYPAWVGPTIGRHRLLFAVKECKEGYECTVPEASLQIYFQIKLRVAKPRTKLINVNIRDVRSRWLLTTETKLLSNSCWLKFNIKPAVEKWIANTINNQGIKVFCFGCGANIEAALWFWKWKKDPISFPNPILTLRLKSKKKQLET